MKIFKIKKGNKNMEKMIKVFVDDVEIEACNILLDKTRIALITKAGKYIGKGSKINVMIDSRYTDSVVNSNMLLSEENNKLIQDSKKAKQELKEYVSRNVFLEDEVRVLKAKIRELEKTEK